MGTPYKFHQPLSLNLGPESQLLSPPNYRNNGKLNCLGITAKSVIYISCTAFHRNRCSLIVILLYRKTANVVWLDGHSNNEYYIVTGMYTNPKGQIHKLCASIENLWI